MTMVRALAAFVCCLPLAGCGVNVPSLGALPDASAGEVQAMNAALVRSVVCELSYAVTQTVRNDLRAAHRRVDHVTHADFYANWGAEVAIDLNTQERTSASPSALWTPSKMFSLAGNVSAGAQSSNDNVINLFFPFSELYKPDMFEVLTDKRPCRDANASQLGSPLIDIDLRILPLLESRVQIVSLKIADSPDRQVKIKGANNVLTQTVFVKQSVSGGLTPTWTFTNLTVDSSPPLLSAGRDRTHQITFTFGPMDDGKQALTPLAEAFHRNEQLRASLRGIGSN